MEDTTARAKTAVSWTARQREVLDLVARGYTNPEIASHLGISLDGAKWHVSEIISKLGVSTREEAADFWVRENRLTIRFGRRFRAVFALGGLRWAVGSAAVGAIVVVGFALLIAAVSEHEGAEANDMAPTAVPTDVELMRSAEAFAATVMARDWSALLDHVLVRDLTCPTDPEEAQTLVLCQNEPPGATVRGVPVAAILHRAGFATLETVPTFLESNVLPALPNEQDEFGHGGLRLYAIGRYESSGEQGVWLLFSYLTAHDPGQPQIPGPQRRTLQLRLQPTAEGEWKITYLVARPLSLDAHLAEALSETEARINGVDWRPWRD